MVPVIVCLFITNLHFVVVTVSLCNSPCYDIQIPCYNIPTSFTTLYS